ncbi:MAG: DUF2493 domain-containing protein, partial [Bacteroidales bacterium]|nr:DUF2493 domain-containing protein [Bacteroidales bacterium]
VIEGFKKSVIVSGGAKGIDSFAKQYALERNIPYMEFPPDYAKYGRVAPLVRNQEIVDYCDKVIAFPSKESRGTYDTIKKAKARNKVLKIVEI